MSSVAAALRGRISTRAFRPDPLPLALLRDILDTARWSPSGGNLQPWRVIAVAGAERDALCALAQQRIQENPHGEAGDRPIYPSALWEPYRSRRFAVGEAMYELLGVSREDKLGRLGWLSRNYAFFDAPVALFFVIDERMGHGQWAHLGMFMQSIALAAFERGVASCFLESWAMLRQSLKAHFALPAEEMVYCAMALGFADDAAPVNRLRSERASLEELIQFRGFDGT